MVILADAGYYVGAERGDVEEEILDSGLELWIDDGVGIGAYNHDLGDAARASETLLEEFVGNVGLSFDQQYALGCKTLSPQQYG